MSSGEQGTNACAPDHEPDALLWGNVALRQDAQNQHLSQEEGIVLIIGMLDSFVLLYRRRISQMNTVVTSIHQTVDQPVPIESGFDDDSVKLNAVHLACEVSNLKW